MSLLVRNIVRKAHKREDKPKALSFFYDGYFDNYLVNHCNIELYGNILSSKYRWAVEESTKLNYIPETFANAEHDIDLDFVIANMTYGNQLVAAQNIARFYHLPLLVFNHNMKPVLRDSVVNLGNSFTYLYPDYEEVEKDIDILLCGHFSNNEINSIHEILGRIPRYNTVIWNMAHTSMGWGLVDGLFARSKTYLHIDSLGDIPHNLYRAMHYKCGIASIDMGLYNAGTGVYSNNMSTLANSINRLLTNKEALNNAISENTEHWNNNVRAGALKAIDQITNIFDEFKNKALII